MILSRGLVILRQGWCLLLNQVIGARWLWAVRSSHWYLMVESLIPDDCDPRISIFVFWSSHWYPMMILSWGWRLSVDRLIDIGWWFWPENGEHGDCLEINRFVSDNREPMIAIVIRTSYWYLMIASWGWPLSLDRVVDDDCQQRVVIVFWSSYWLICGDFLPRMDDFETRMTIVFESSYRCPMIVSR